MTEIRFYHLTRRSLEDVLPVMLERTLVRDGKRAIVMLGSAERVEHLNAHLWTYNDRSFLPHGSQMGCRMATHLADRQRRKSQRRGGPVPRRRRRIRRRWRL